MRVKMKEPQSIFQLGFDATKSMLNVLLRHTAKVTSNEESGPKLLRHASKDICDEKQAKLAILRLAT